MEEDLEVELAAEAMEAAADMAEVAMVVTAVGTSATSIRLPLTPSLCQLVLMP